MSPNTILWSYIVLLVAGGMMGLLKAGSKTSLFTSLIFAALLSLCAMNIIRWRYAVDFMRDAYYGGAGSGIPLFDTSTNFAIIGAMFVVFMVVGTFLFVRAERNR